MRERQHALTIENAKAVFRTQFERYTNEFGFVPWVTPMLDGH